MDSLIRFQSFLLGCAGVKLGSTRTILNEAFPDIQLDDMAIIEYLFELLPCWTLDLIPNKNVL